MNDALQCSMPDEGREERLFEIGRQARERGQVDAVGIRPAGAPFPLASPATGYYGVPLLKRPAWTWEIPLYFFIGGAAGSASVLAIPARWIARDRKLARDCRYIAAAGTLASSMLLIADLGRPARFLAMLRVFKKQSPMSVGAWTLAAFGSFASASALAELLHQRFSFKPLRVVGDATAAFSALAGLPFSNYTGVLIGASVIPVWNENVATLPIHFGMSGLNAAISMLELLGHEHRALNTLGMGASAVETLEGVNIESRRTPKTEPLRRGRSGALARIGGLLSGPFPLALRVAAGFVGQRRSRQLRKIAAVSSIAGSVLTRISWVQAGQESAKNWRLPLQE